MYWNNLKRRDFLGVAALGTLPGMRGSSRNAAQASEKPLLKARQKLDGLRITGMGFLRLRYPGKTPRKWNSIIVSGGGSPGMTQLELYTSEGIIGRSLPKARGLIESYIFPKIKGENPLDVERIWDKVYRHNRKPVAKGLFIEALGSVDMALWDIVGKVLGLPVYRVLGAHKKKIRVYAAGGYYQEGKRITVFSMCRSGRAWALIRIRKWSRNTGSANGDRWSESLEFVFPTFALKGEHL